MLKIFKQKSKSKWLVLGTVVLGLGLFFNVHYARANWLTDLLGLGAEGVGYGLYLILGAVIQGVAYFIGHLLVAITDILFSVAQYDKFVDNNVVLTGWPVIRDFCNMFFILILLVIAFATILRVENYGIKRLLPKLVIMAVLINFSKTICGLLIDFSQIIMLTLINSVGNAAGNLYEAFGIGKIWEIQSIVSGDVFTDKSITGISLFSSLLLGLVILIIAGIVISIYTIILAFRIVAFWILIILSPLAFIASTLPGLSGRVFSPWLSQFTNYLIVGPVMAFFLWLALSTVGQVKSTFEYADFEYQDPQTQTGAKEVSAFLTKAGSKDNLIKFIVSTCLLLGGLMAAQQLGVAGSKAAGSALAYIQRGGWAGKKAGEFLQGFRDARKRKIAAAGGPKAQRMGGRLFGAVSGTQRLLATPLRGAVGAAKTAPGVKWGLGKVDQWKQGYRSWVKDRQDARIKKMKDRQTLLDAERTGIYKKKELLQYEFDGVDEGKYYKKEDWAGDRPKDKAKEAGSFKKMGDGKYYAKGDFDSKGALKKDAQPLFEAEEYDKGEYVYDKELDKYYRKNDWNEKKNKPEEGAKELATWDKEYGYKDGKYYDKEDWDEKDKKPKDKAKEKGEAEPIGYWGKVAQSMWAQVDKGSSLAIAFRNSEQNNRAGIEQKKMEHLDKAQLANIMGDASTSNDQRIATAIILAIQKGFQDAGQVALAKNVIAGNAPLLKQFNEGMNKGQAHLNFDFDKDKDKDLFDKLVARGELDTSKQESEAYKDEKFLKAMKGALGKEFAEKIVSASKQSADHRDKVMNGLEKIFDKKSGLDPKDIPIERKIFAQISGDLRKALWDYQKGSVNEEAVAELVKSAKPEHYGKIDAKILKDDEGLLKIVAENSTYGQLRSVHRKGEAPDLARAVIEKINEIFKKEEATFKGFKAREKKGETLTADEEKTKKRLENMEKIIGDDELGSYLA
ncbi:MAG: hypothetical protein V1684_00360 [bacterium]